MSEHVKIKYDKVVVLLCVNNNHWVLITNYAKQIMNTIDSMGLNRYDKEVKGFM